VRIKRMVEHQVAWLMVRLGLGRGVVLVKVCFTLVFRNCSILTREGFAIGENKAILAALIGSFDFKPVGGKTQDLEIMYGLTVRIIGGLPVEVTAVDGW
jgi:hypothetical protein